MGRDGSQYEVEEGQGGEGAERADRGASGWEISAYTPQNTWRRLCQQGLTFVVIRS